jgi:hypothetical protein
MFDFLKPAVRPEEFGLALADVLVEKWFGFVDEQLSEFRVEIPDISAEEINHVWRILVLICCSAIDVGIEKTKFSESEKRIIHFVFWRAFAESLEERRSKADPIVFKKDIDDGFETIKSLILDPTPYSSPGSLGPGKYLLPLVSCRRDTRTDIRFVMMLSDCFFILSTPLIEFTIGSSKRMKLSETQLRLENQGT